MRKWLIAFIAVGALPTLGSADETKIEGQYGSWSVVAVTDVMTDKTWHAARSYSKTGDLLQVDCSMGAPHAQFYMKRYLSSEVESGKAIYRVDMKSANYIVVSYFKNSARLLCVDSCGSSEDKTTDVNQVLMNEIESGTNLRLRLTTPDYDTLELEFPIDGASEAIDHIQPGCNKH